MKHLGDITKIKGNEAPIVDCIIGGSPCQDLSLAGKRAGLAGARSGLYMEQIRLIKEMRENDRNNGRTGVDIRPRYMVWENVPGAFSTNGGQDFAAVLEEAIRVAEPEAPNVSVPEKGWPTAGCIVGDNWSIAWRVLDAQFWGVPQRRRRIALVADFGGLSAPEILFVRKSVSGDLEPGEPKRKEAPRDAGNGAGGAIGCDTYNYTITGDKACTLNSNSCITSSRLGPTVAVPCTLKIRGGCEGGGKGALIQEDKSATLSTLQDQTLFQPIIAVDQGGGKSGANSYEDVSPTLTCTHGGEPAVLHSVGIVNAIGGNAENYKLSDHMPSLTNGNAPGFMNAIALKTYQKVTGPLMANSHPGSYTGQDAFSDMLVAGVEERPIALDRAFYNQVKNALYEPQYYEDGTVPTLVAKGPAAVSVKHIVRRLTPLECERLQGYPDGWTDIGEWVDSKGKKHKEADSPRYKALGNSIAIPPWKWVLKRLCACYERDATMASLFDGIGGFPYIWEQLNGKGSCLWASEIEEFPMAVTKLRFGGSENG